MHTSLEAKDFRPHAEERPKGASRSMAAQVVLPRRARDRERSPRPCFETAARKSGLPDLRTKEVPDLGYTRDQVRPPQHEGGASFAGDPFLITPCCPRFRADDTEIVTTASPLP